MADFDNNQLDQLFQREREDCSDPVLAGCVVIMIFAITDHDYDSSNRISR